MFNELPLSGPDRHPTRTHWTFLLSLGGELIVLSILLVIPLIYVQGLPFSWQETTIAAPPNIAPLQARQVPTQRRTATSGIQRVAVPAFAAPYAMNIRGSRPTSPFPTTDLASVPGGFPSAAPGPWTSIFSHSNPTPPAAGSSGGSSPLSVGGKVEEAKLLQMVQPTYPAIAREARIQGTVKLGAIIGQDGKVKSLRYLSGPLPLVPAAVDAVRQWLYRPTLLNGKPVAVKTTIQVIFTLENGEGHDPAKPAPLPEPLHRS